MTDAERKKTEAERLLAEIAPYCEQVERDAYERLLLETDPDKVMEHQRFINATRGLKDALKSAITLGKQAAKQRVSVA
jgi:hypothetical protein